MPNCKFKINKNINKNINNIISINIITNIFINIFNMELIFKLKLINNMII